MTTPLDLEAIRERLNRITPGPWLLNDEQDIAGAGGELVVWAYPNEGGGLGGRTFEEMEANGQFIANAPTDIAGLLEEVERLGRELADARVLGRWRGLPRANSDSMEDVDI